MADLSAVLRKTIDGLPKASPDLRAKVYEKARSAIERQISAASPPLSESVIEARRSALADAIDRTEDHYLELDAGQPETPQQAAPQQAAPVPPRPTPASSTAASSTPASPSPASPSPASPPMASPPPPKADRAPGPSAQTPGPARPAVSALPPATPPVAKPAWQKAALGEGGELRRTGGETSPPTRQQDERKRQAPATERAGPPMGAPASAGVSPAAKPSPAAPQVSSDSALKPQPPRDRTEPDSGLDSIPAADVAAPRYTNGRRPAKAGANRTPILVGLAVLLLGGGAALSYVYRDDIQGLLTSPNGEATKVAATTPPAASSSASPDASGTPATPTTPADTAGQPATGDGDKIAALTPGGTPPATGASPQTSKRRFTQRLLPDGTEVDEGPGTPETNAFDEGTNIAAASPPDTSATLAPATPPGADTAPAASDAATATPPAEATAPAGTTPPAASGTQSAALPPATVAGAPAVAQKAVFYEERTETEQGSQQAGDVVWSVVNESPSEGQPPEPAIRAVTDIPDKNIKLTMTIRRNADPTLPASHVIELMFDVPDDFPGGQIANVQRLALKPTEEARGEPLIGVAGKISDGFFIIALNNLEQATKSNLALMGKEEWIDIPIAYATGRRALISIDKGIPGERAFKQAMDAWAAKT